ncbi:MAG: hypothetical protein U1A26_00710, partial [Candidatus Sungbacteria bacterium]|nr:hypothetical protein [Candidatus Sungbacteria bacterium]
EIETEFDEDSSRSFATELAGAHLFLLGETHGVLENPNIIYTLYKKFGFRNLYFEWSKGLQNTTGHFLNSGELDFASIEKSCDGRITAGHFSLLKKLKTDGALDTVRCFDGLSWSGSWNLRDEQMAKNILTDLPELSTLVVAGKLHTPLVEPEYFKDDPIRHHPMGEHIKKQIANVLSGRIDYYAGRYHNIGVQEFDESVGEKPLRARFYKSSEGLYIFDLPEAHDGAVPNPHETRESLSPEKIV